MKRRMLAAVSGFCMMVAAGQAAAQSEVQAGTEVEALTVTAEKTERSLQDTVSSAAVVTAQRIDREAMQDVYDVIHRTPNVTETFGDSGFTIRGISNNTVSGGGGGGLATILVDGAPIPQPFVYSAPLDAWDLSQIEILRGPQSTLQGRNALGGTITIRSAEPTMEWDARTRLQLSDDGGFVGAVAAGGPILPDQLAFRVSVEDRVSDGFVYNPVRNEDVTALESITGRLKVLATPTALPGLTLRAGWTHYERDGGYIYTFARTDVPDYFENQTDLSNDPNSSVSRTDILTGQADYQLSDALTLTGVLTWLRAKEVSASDGDFGPTTLAFSNRKVVDEQSTQEVRLAYKGERLNGLVGLYHSQLDETDDYVNRATVPLPVSTVVAALRAPPPFGAGLSAVQANAVAAAYAAQLPAVPVNQTATNPVEIETTALFADGAFSLTDQLSLLAGFRWDNESNTTGGSQVATFAGRFPTAPAALGPSGPLIFNSINGFVAAQIAQANAVATSATREFDAFLPKLGLKYDVTDDLSASFVVQRGYRSGGSSLNIARALIVEYEPEYTWNYEAALRSTWLDGKLRVNANAFYTDWEDQQVVVDLGLNVYDFQTANAGESHLYGFELDVAHQVTPQLSWYAGAGYTKTEFDDFTLANGGGSTDLSGSEFAFAPRWTVAAGVDWVGDNGLVANLNANYRSSAYGRTGVSTQAAKDIDARTIVGGRVGYQAERWGAFVFGSNLFDEAYINYARTADRVAILGEPRVVGIVLEARR